MEDYRSKSIEELTNMLRLLVENKGRNPGLSTEMRDLVCMLKAHKLRHGVDAHAFAKCGGIPVLINLMKECEGKSQVSRDLVLVLGTIGNLCALSSNSRSIVVTSGLERIVGYLQLSTDTASTAARVLANLALDACHLPLLHSHAVVGKFCQLLSVGNIDNNCKRNVVRGLRLLCSSPECLEELKCNDGVSLLVEYLSSEHVELAMGAIQAIETASNSGDTDIIQRICQRETMQNVIRYCNHSKTKVKKSAINTLLNCVKISDGRIALSSAGGVETLVGCIESFDKTSSIFGEIVCAACTCCRDVISRQRLRDCGGLQRLITMLADPCHASLHGNLMSALVCYYFDENTIKLMVTKMGLLRTLNYHLQKMVSMSKDAHESADKDRSLEEKEAGSHSHKNSSVDTMECQSTHFHKTDEPHTSMTAMDSPPPTKRPRLEAETESTTPTTFLDSLLSSPSPYKISSSSSQLDSPLIAYTGSTFESQVILMVSRMSHLRDCLITLSYPDTLLTIFNYFISTKPPNIHIFKVLTRIFMNPHCFQNCITSLIPSKLYELLEEPSDPPPSPITASLDGDLSVVSFHGMCRILMDHISKNAESPYGQGVLAHLLLRGSEKEKQASSLSMPLLCRSPRVCQKLMVDYGAFHVLCGLLRDESGTGELKEMALGSLLALGCNMELVCSQKRRYFHPTKFFPGRLNSSFKDLSLTEPENFPQCDSEDKEMVHCQSTYCRYMDTDHNPFDLKMVLHTPLGEIIRISAHKSILVEESDVFRVMLGGNYKESSDGEVHIHSIYPGGFLSLLHHIYGCGWLCRTLLAEVFKMSEEAPMTSTLYSDILSEVTDDLLKEIVTPLLSKEEVIQATHCLQVLVCAGRFLFPELITLCEHAAVNYMCPPNMMAMFHFSRLHQCFCLGESCIRALVSLPHSQLRTDTFREVVDSSEGEAALQIISLILTETNL